MVKWTLTMLNHLKMVPFAKDTKPNSSSIATVMSAWPRRILYSQLVIKICIHPPHNVILWRRVSCANLCKDCVEPNVVNARLKPNVIVRDGQLICLPTEHNRQSCVYPMPRAALY